jgi:hypothetical protein
MHFLGREEVDAAQEKNECGEGLPECWMGHKSL